MSNQVETFLNVIWHATLYSTTSKVSSTFQGRTFLEPTYSKKYQSTWLVCDIEDLWRFWMVPNWPGELLGLIYLESVWNHSGPSDVCMPMVCMPNGIYHSIKLPFDAEVAEKLYNDFGCLDLLSCVLHFCWSWTRFFTA